MFYRRFFKILTSAQILGINPFDRTSGATRPLKTAHKKCDESSLVSMIGCLGSHSHCLRYKHERQFKMLKLYIIRHCVSLWAICLAWWMIDFAVGLIILLNVRHFWAHHLSLKCHVSFFHSNSHNNILSTTKISNRRLIKGVSRRGYRWHILAVNN